MRKPIKYVEKAAVAAAKGAWVVFDRLNRINPGVSPTPKWSDKPLLKSYEKSKPPLGWPRSTDSLCPKCVPEIRQQILDGKLPVEILMNEKAGEIKAQIVERDGKILMVKDCPTHGHFEDVMSIDTEFSKHLEDVFPGRDIRAHNDAERPHIPEERQRRRTDGTPALPQSSPPVMQQQKQEDAEDDRSGSVPNRVHQLWFVNVGHACSYSTVGRVTGFFELYFPSLLSFTETLPD